jgi:hypothetical protein
MTCRKPAGNTGGGQFAPCDNQQPGNTMNSLIRGGSGKTESETATAAEEASAKLPVTPSTRSRSELVKALSRQMTRKGGTGEVTPQFSTSRETDTGRGTSRSMSQSNQRPLRPGDLGSGVTISSSRGYEAIRGIKDLQRQSVDAITRKQMAELDLEEGVAGTTVDDVDKLRNESNALKKQLEQMREGNPEASNQVKHIKVRLARAKKIREMKRNAEAIRNQDKVTPRLTQALSAFKKDESEASQKKLVQQILRDKPVLDDDMVLAMESHAGELEKQMSTMPRKDEELPKKKEEYWDIRKHVAAHKFFSSVYSMLEYAEENNEPKIRNEAMHRLKNPPLEIHHSSASIEGMGTEDELDENGKPIMQGAAHKVYGSDSSGVSSKGKFRTSNKPRSL